MPLIKISLIKGKPREHLRALSDGVHRGLVETYGVPADDVFHLIHQYDRDELIYDRSYLGINRTDDVVIIQIVVSNWRETVQKKALFASITDNLVRQPGLRPEDVMIVLSPNSREDWSFGNGVASYATDDPS